MRIFVPCVLGALLAVSGCMPSGGIGALFGQQVTSGPPVAAAGADTPRPAARPASGPGAGAGAPLSAMTAPVIVARAPAAGALLGREQATLGDPAAPGLWLSTRHVQAPISGRVVVVGTGRSATLELRPSGGAGGRLSLGALRALGLPLTALAEVEVYAGG